MAEDSRFRLTAEQGRDLASEYGTPLYVLDEHSIRSRAQKYRTAFRAVWPKSELSFASKANSTLAVLRILYSEGFSIDCASEGELRAALAAGVPGRSCHFHGNNKQRSELEFALSVGVGRIIIDHFGEIEMLAELGARCPCALRFAPGVDPKTHVKISTGQADTKFGFNAATGDAERALGLALKFGLEVDGFHCHVGSQLIDTEAQQRGGEELVRFAAQMQRSQGFHMTYLNVGGGLGVRYSDSDHPMEVEAYCQELVGTIQESLRGTNLKTNDLVLAQEPGRSIIAEAGVTLYQIGPIKEVPISATNFRTYVSVDGGLSDNPRPALYNAQYPIEVIPQSDRSTWDYVVDGPGAAFAVPRNKTVHISGKHCETDLLFPDVTVPADLVSGDLIQVLCTGAYNATMASNYNRYPRPASVLLRMNGQAELVQRRETFDEMLAREILPRGL